MNRKSTRLKALVVTVATPNLVAGALATAKNDVEGPSPHGEVAIASDAAVVVGQRNQLVQRGQTLTANQARRAVRNELAKMTPEQKARLGKSQVELENLAVQPANATKCGGNVTQGVFCADPFSGGFLCCIVTLGPPAGG